MDRKVNINRDLCDGFGGLYFATYIEKVDDTHLAMHFDNPLVKKIVWDLEKDEITIFSFGFFSSELVEQARYHFNLAHFVLCKDPYHDLRKTLEEMYNDGKIFHKLIEVRAQDCGEILGNRMCFVFGPEQPGHYTPFILYTPDDFLDRNYFNFGTFYRYDEMGIAVTHYCDPHRLFGNEEFVNICVAIQDFYMNATEI